jgi:hypothetical protein
LARAAVAQPTDTPTPTPTHTSTPTAAPSPTPTPQSEVLEQTNPPSGGSAGEPRSVAALLAPNQLSTNARVIGTNLILAIILLVALFFSSAVFNSTLEEHRVEVQAFAFRMFAPFRSFGRALPSLWVPGYGARTVERVIGPILILLLTGFIYTFNSPGIGLNETTLAYFLSLVIGLGIMTYVYEGGEALLTTHRFRTPAAVRLVPIAPVIAVAFVLLSRITGFEVPIMYGFVASATILVAAELEHRHSAFAVLVPAIVLLALSLAAWALLIPFRHLSNSNEWWSHIPTETAALIFVGGIEGLLFAMIPMRFMDGSKVFRWYRLFWVPLFFIPAFIFSWAILNPEAQAFDSLLQGRVIFALSLVGAYLALALATWAYFAFRPEHTDLTLPPEPAT